MAIVLHRLVANIFDQYDLELEAANIIDRFEGSALKAAWYDAQAKEREAHRELSNIVVVAMLNLFIPAKSLHSSLPYPKSSMQSQSLYRKS